MVSKGLQSLRLWLVLISTLVALGLLLRPAEAALPPSQAGASAAPTPCVSPQFTVVTSPNVPGAGNNVLYDVGGAAPDDLWATGFDQTGPNFTIESLLEHWDGTAWSLVPAPGPGSYLEGIAALARNDVWIVGNTSGGQPTTITLHWDGSTLTRIASPSPAPGVGYNALYAADGRASNDVWAVGSYENAGLLTLVEHWDGLAWSIVPSPNGGTQSDNELSGVAAVGPNDVWAVGSVTSNPNTPQPLIEHWDGQAWSIVPAPNLGSVNAMLTGVAAVSPNNVWAVGSADQNGTFRTLVLHWDGVAWSRIASPNDGATENHLNAVAVTTANDIWAVGASGGFLGAHTLAMHWDGQAWTIVPSADPNTGENLFLGMAAITGGGIWAAGLTAGGPSAPETLIERLITCPPPTPTATATAPPGPSFTPTPTPRPNQRLYANICLSLQADPDGAVPPGGLITYTVRLLNNGPGEADDTNLRLPLDPNLEVLDFASSNPRIYVDYLGEDAVAVRFHDLSAGTGGTARIIARVRPGAPDGATITTQALVTWDDLAHPHHTHHSNTVRLKVGPAADSKQHGLRQPLTVTPAGGGYSARIRGSVLCRRGAGQRLAKPARWHRARVGSPGPQRSRWAGRGAPGDDRVAARPLYGGGARLVQRGRGSGQRHTALMVAGARFERTTRSV